MDREPRWGRGWISLGVWIGIESVLFLSVLAVGLLAPAIVETVVSGSVGAARLPEVASRVSTGSWFVAGPHLLGLLWILATERRRLLARMRPSVRARAWGLGGGAGMIVVGGAWSFLLEATGVEPPDMAAYLKSALPSPALLLLWGAGLVPIVEEGWFRGRCLEAVRERLDTRWALLLTSVLFAAVHGIVVFFPAYLALAAILFALRERTGGLFAPIVAHAVNNAWGLLIPS